MCIPSSIPPAAVFMLFSISQWMVYCATCLARMSKLLHGPRHELLWRQHTRIYSLWAVHSVQQSICSSRANVVMQTLSHFAVLLSHWSRSYSFVISILSYFYSEDRLDPMGMKFVTSVRSKYLSFTVWENGLTLIWAVIKRMWTCGLE